MYKLEGLGLSKFPHGCKKGSYIASSCGGALGRVFLTLADRSKLEMRVVLISRLHRHGLKVEPFALSSFFGRTGL